MGWRSYRPLSCTALQSSKRFLPGERAHGALPQWLAEGGRVAPQNILGRYFFECATMKAGASPVTTARTTPEVGPMQLQFTALQRFCSQVEFTEDCWLWRGWIEHHGYGRFRADGKRYYAHRWAYEAMVGPIPDGLTLDHLCRNRACVKPDHLQPVSNKTNILRGDSPSAVNARKTHCPQGHEYTPQNTYGWHGWRLCRECHRHHARTSSARKRASVGSGVPRAAL